MSAEPSVCPALIARAATRLLRAIGMSTEELLRRFYEVEEVPWTLYYHGGYALHGAYWHTDFGKVRSHGCTNIAPVGGTTMGVAGGKYDVGQDGTVLGLIVDVDPTDAGNVSRRDRTQPHVVPAFGAAVNRNGKDEFERENSQGHEP